MPLRRRLPGWLLAVAVLVAASPSPGAVWTGNPAEVGPFLDGLIEGLMAARRIPGAVAVVVKDGGVVYQRGYGYADPQKRSPVDPETTLFRVASISKLFTATAVMQLVEQKRLDLDADVNTYLQGVQVPPAFGAPITLRHLLTHTAGFDDSFLESAEPLGAPPEPLAHYLARRLPPRVMPPGELLSYSNHGIALAGLIVEQVSGRPFAQYVREEILLPLEMTHSGFGLPDPPPPQLAVGHLWRGKDEGPAGVDRIRWAPAGDLYTRATDMARFALAHLADGRIPGSQARILGAETARAMHAQAFTHRPEQVGWCLGFAERRWNGMRAIGHSGDWRGFGSELVLVPEAGLGVFVSTTRSYDVRFFDAFWGALFDRFFPRPAAAPLAAQPEAKARARELAGAYIPNRHVRGDLLKLGLLLGTLRIAAQDDGSIQLRFTGGEREPIRAVEVASGLWRSDRSDTLVSFRSDADGAAHAIVDAFVFDRVPWWRDPERHKLILAGCALVFSATLVGLGVAGLARRLWGGPPSASPRPARALAASLSALSLALLAAIAYGLTSLSPHQIMEGIPGWLFAVSWLPVLSIPLSLLLPWLLWRWWRSPVWTPLARLHFALLTLACAVFAALAWSYHLIGLR